MKFIAWMLLVVALFFMAATAVVIGSWHEAFGFSFKRETMPEVNGNEMFRKDRSNTTTAIHIQKGDDISARYKAGTIGQREYRELMAKEKERYEQDLCINNGTCLGPSSFAPPSSSALQPNQGLGNELVFKELESTNPSVRRFQISATVAEQELPFEAGSYLETWFDAGAQVCVPVDNQPPDCNGPEGRGEIPDKASKEIWDNPHWMMSQYPVRSARYQSAVGYIGTEKFQIGQAGHYVWSIPAGMENEHPRVGFNIRSSQLERASGGGVLNVRLKK